MSDVSIAVVGAGPAGLTAAYDLTKRGFTPTVYERDRLVGGISRTEQYRGYRFDIGGHRFFTKVPEVNALWHEILQEDFIRRSRLSRIYYKGKFYRYPLALWNTLTNLGPIESMRILGSYLNAKIGKPLPEENLEQWVINRFGDRLYRTFFKTYTEKVWGIPCTEIRADWAAQRIRGVSVRRALTKAITGKSDQASLIDEFWYPRLGPGMLWERCTELVEARGGAVRMREEVVTLHHDGQRVHAIDVRKLGPAPTDTPIATEASGDGIAGEQVPTAAPAERVTVEHVINSMPLGLLVQRLDPPPPPEVLQAARSLRYRDFLVVVLILDETDLFPDNWIYIHAPEVQVGRIQNFRNWSPDLVPDLATTSLGMEYFCNEGDELWEMDDADLIALASAELEQIDLAGAGHVVDGTVIRQRKAYPVYDGTYQQHVATIRDYLAGFENLQSVGRAGLHRYNNQDHSMLTALLASANIAGDLRPDGAPHDVWSVNVERSYHEEFVVDKTSKAGGHTATDPVPPAVGKGTTVPR